MSIELLEKLADEIDKKEKDDGDENEVAAKDKKKEPFSKMKKAPVGEKGHEQTVSNVPEKNPEGGEPKEAPDERPGEKAANPEEAPQQEMQEHEQPGSVDPSIIIDFLAQNPAPADTDFHQFVESQGLDTPTAESVAYMLAGKYVMLLRGGKSQGMDMSTVDPQQLEMGMRVEAEHSADPATQKKISLDHIAENPLYYQYLAEMEKKIGEQK